MNVSIERASARDAGDIAVMAGELFEEIMHAIAVQAFNFSLPAAEARAREFIATEKYFAFLARGEDRRALGFLAMYESHALYAEGTFATIAELYVRPACRSQGLGRGLLQAARTLAAARGWTRLEVTTPPLPQFAGALRFYEREGFAVTGGRKLKTALEAV